MTKAQLKRNSGGGKACFIKYGNEHFAMLGRKGGVKSSQARISKGVVPGSRSIDEMLEILRNKVNLAKGGLPIARAWCLSL